MILLLYFWWGAIFRLSPRCLSCSWSCCLCSSCLANNLCWWCLHWHRLCLRLIVLFTEPKSSEGFTKFDPKAMRLSGLFSELTIFYRGWAKRVHQLYSMSNVIHWVLKTTIFCRVMVRISFLVHEVQSQFLLFPKKVHWDANWIYAWEFFCLANFHFPKWCQQQQINENYNNSNKEVGKGTAKYSIFAKTENLGGFPKCIIIPFPFTILWNFNVF